MNYPIPELASQAFEAHVKRNQPSNPGLVFDRFTPDIACDSKLKKPGLEQVREIKRDGALRQAVLARWQEMAKAIGATPFTLKTDWRYVSGVGRNTPYEVGFRFDRYGFAALPGSGLKGIARAFALYEIAVALQLKEGELKKFNDGVLGESDNTKYGKEIEKRATDDAGRALCDCFRLVFGTTGQTGRAIFLDGVPAGDPALELDIINPHYPQYYQGTQPPTNWQSPTPIFFLTVQAGVPFEFAVGWRGEPDADAQGQAVAWLKNGLTELGAGAKTNAGYGYFAEASEPTAMTSSRSNLDVSAMPPPTKPAEPPMGELKPGTGKLERKRSREGEQLFVKDGDFRLPVVKERLGPSFNSLPGDDVPVTYQYDDVNGERRVWRVNKKSNLKGL